MQFTQFNIDPNHTVGMMTAIVRGAQQKKVSVRSMEGRNITFTVKAIENEDGSGHSFNVTTHKGIKLYVHTDKDDRIDLVCGPIG